MAKRMMRFGIGTVILCALILNLRISSQPSVYASCPVRFQQQLLIVDPGHGGEDGGAVSMTGACESQINLAVAKRLDTILGLYGMPVLLTREEDISLHSDGASTLREKKTSDLHNRTALVERQENAILLSIHQNSYPDPRYSGAQVFFAPTDGSEELAQTLQEALRAALAPDNQRQAKLIPDTIYLMNHISCTGVLVECGFLTNAQEEQLLLDAAYQIKVAAALAGGFLQYQTTLT